MALIFVDFIKKNSVFLISMFFLCFGTKIIYYKKLYITINVITEMNYIQVFFKYKYNVKACTQ